MVSEYMILPIPPQAVKLNDVGLANWNSYCRVGSNCPNADTSHVFVVNSLEQGGHVLLLEHPFGYELYMPRSICIPMQYNTTTREWEQIDE